VYLVLVCNARRYTSLACDPQDLWSIDGTAVSTGTISDKMQQDNYSKVEDGCERCADGRPHIALSI
jgi:hypothetical protein